MCIRMDIIYHLLESPVAIKHHPVIPGFTNYKPPFTGFPLATVDNLLGVIHSNKKITNKACARINLSQICGAQSMP